MFASRAREKRSLTITLVSSPFCCQHRPDNVEPIEAIARLRSNGTTLGNKRFQILNDRQDPLLPAFSWPRTAQQAEDMSEKIFKMNVKVMDRCIRGNLPDYSFV